MSNIEKVDTSVSKTGTLRTFFNIMRGFIGVGFLTVPYLIENIGWYGLLIGYPLTCFAVIYGIWLLNKLADELEYTGGSFENLMKIIFGDFGYNFTCVILVINQLCTCIANILFVVNFLDFVFCEHNVESLCGQKYLFTLYC